MDFKFNFGVENEKEETKLEKDVDNNFQHNRTWKDIDLSEVCSVISLVNESNLYDVDAISSESKNLPVYGLTIHVPEDMIKQKSHFSDVIHKVYEGGATVWECTKDLINYLEKNMKEMLDKEVLDLGCGLGILGSFSLIHGKAAAITFQDYNENVIKNNTMPTILYNWMKCVVNNDLENEELEQEKYWKEFCNNYSITVPTELQKLTSFIIGDWQSLPHTNGKRYDVILSSETIYNCDYYESLHEYLQASLAPTGLAYFATKSHYFGVGGGLTSWTDFVEKKKVFLIEIVDIISQESLLRYIFKMKYKS